MAAPQGKGGDAAQPERKKKESILGITYYGLLVLEL